ncbi:MAG: DUF3050 domain-containing protein [Chitinophagales bacterium]|nr:DUF3050 domain-containing protein [Chitinophagales bacterium]
MDPIERIEAALEPQRKALREHKLYRLLHDIEDVQRFMELHVYAVWDFMSLLKALQKELTCTTLPWRPAGSAKIARFINEIVLGEESDVNEHGVPGSHFEMYLEAMQEVGADTSKVLALVETLDSLDHIDERIASAGLDPAASEFLRFTFRVIGEKAPHKIASAFTFGREDLIPDMFIQIIEQASEGGVNRFPKLTYYLVRHIEVDGDEHGPLALEMMKALCGNDAQKWDEALEVAKAALQQRIALWDAIAEKIEMVAA